MAEAEREKSPGFSRREIHTVYSIVRCMFITIYGMQKRGFTLRALEIGHLCGRKALSGQAGFRLIYDAIVF